MHTMKVYCNIVMIRLFKRAESRLAKQKARKCNFDTTFVSKTEFNPPITMYKYQNPIDNFAASSMPLAISQASSSFASANLHSETCIESFGNLIPYLIYKSLLSRYVEKGKGNPFSINFFSSHRHLHLWISLDRPTYNIRNSIRWMFIHHASGLASRREPS
jgi:hypothetical protein